ASEPSRRRGPINEAKEEEEEEEERQLEIVDMSGMALDSLPNPSPLNIVTICKLDLSSNNLQSIPESLTARMLNLIVFDVHSNQLKSLPNSIGCLSKLKTLNVSANFLESLPTTIQNCRSLEDLNANFNKLTKLPDTIGLELVNLKKLSVNSNKLIYLPHSISHLTNLRTLDARLNCLRSLPDTSKTLSTSKSSTSAKTSTTSPPYPTPSASSSPSSNWTEPPCFAAGGGCRQGLHAVKEYLSEKMNGSHKEEESPKKGRSWIGKLVKYGTFNGRRRGGAAHDDQSEGFVIQATDPSTGLHPQGTTTDYYSGLYCYVLVFR
ncbi:hypothetical protein C3L33_03869, partial [Rhododendron williamsianum]